MILTPRQQLGLRAREWRAGRTGLNITEFGETIGVCGSTISGWERGDTRFACDTHQFYRWMTALDVSPKEHKAMLALHSPELDLTKYWNAYFKNEGFLAFNKKWLDTQPLHERFGQYLRACRERAGFTAEEMAGKFGITEGGLLMIERGKRSTPPENAMRMAARLEKYGHDWFDGVRFGELYAESMDAVRAGRRVKAEGMELLAFTAGQKRNKLIS